MLKAGLSVPQNLDPLHEKALKRLYELQAGLDPQSPELKEIRDVSASIIIHYSKLLEYNETARAAIAVKAEKPVPAADEFAAFQMARLQADLADRQFARLITQYGAAEKIAITPEYTNAMAVCMKFISDYQTSPLVPQAVERIFAIGQVFERHQAHAVAAEVYADFAKFAAGENVLSQTIDNAPSTVQRPNSPEPRPWTPTPEICCKKPCPSAKTSPPHRKK